MGFFKNSRYYLNENLNSILYGSRSFFIINFPKDNLKLNLNYNSHNLTINL